MNYTLNFALNLKKEGEHIVYDKENFIQEARISVPDIVSILEKFLQPPFQSVGIVDKPESQKVQSADGFSREKVQGEVKASNENLISQLPLQGLSGQAYYCQIKDLDKAKIKEITSDLSNYLQESISKLNSDNFLADETGNVASGIKQVMEIRNYLALHLKKPDNKKYKKGYLFIMQI